MKRLAIVFPLLLTACAPLFSTVSSYDPEAMGAVIKITDRQQYLSDLAECRAVAIAYREPLSVGSVISGAGVGAAQNAPGAVAVPGGGAIVAVGAAAGATSSALTGLDVLDTDKFIVLGNCLREVSRDDKAFHYVGK